MKSSKLPAMCRTPYNYVAPPSRAISDQKIEEYSQKLLKRLYKNLAFSKKEIQDTKEDMLQELKLFLLMLNTEDYKFIEHRFSFYCIDSRQKYNQMDEVNDINYLSSEPDYNIHSDPEAVMRVQDEVRPVIQGMKNNLLNQDEYEGFIDNYKISSPQTEYELMEYVDFTNMSNLIQRVKSKQTQLIVLQDKDDILSIEFKPQTGKIVDIYDRVMWSRPNNFKHNIKEGFKNYLENIEFWKYVSKYQEQVA